MRLRLAICCGAVLLPCLAAEEEEYRDWKSAQGRTIKAKILGIQDGKVILQPPVKNYEVPLASLSKEDQAFAEAWQKQHAEEQELLAKAREEAIYNTPILKGIRGSLYTVADGQLKPYAIAKPEELKLVAVYYTQKHDDKNIDALNKAYERLRRRSHAFEVVLLSFDPNEKTLIEYVEEQEVAFPIVDLVLAKKTGVSPEVAQAFNGKIIPQLTVFDVKGQKLATSYRSEEDKVQVLDTIKELEKLVRRADGEEGSEEEAPDGAATNS